MLLAGNGDASWRTGQINDGRGRGDDTGLPCVDDASIDAVAEAEIVGVDDEEAVAQWGDSGAADAFRNVADWG